MLTENTNFKTDVTFVESLLNSYKKWFITREQLQKKRDELEIIIF